MTNITIGRYDSGETISDEDGTRPLAAVWAGWIEGEDLAGTGWIIYLDGQGRPAVYFPDRDPSGAVRGEPVPLTEVPAQNTPAW